MKLKFLNTNPLLIDLLTLHLIYITLNLNEN